MTDRVEEIEETRELCAWCEERIEEDELFYSKGGSPFHREKCDIRFLLSEVQRLKKVEEAAREVQDMEHLVEITQGRVGAQARKKLAAGLSSLSNTLEQHIPEPVREEMER